MGPRAKIYADANVPVGVVAFMRARLDWDVVHVLEDPELRRAPDVRHFRLAGELRRTLITLDHDYLDDRRFPPEQSSGVLVLDAPDERELMLLVERLNARLFQHTEKDSAPLPLEGRKLHVHTDWGRED